MSSVIYVETAIKCSLDEIWERTQNPKMHEKWDLRFTEIDYLPVSDAHLQRFLYKTRIGFGLEICGEGETVGQKSAIDSRTSALRFWSDDPRSLIQEGSGYCKYETTKSGVRFLTAYDYRIRFGWFGALMDRCFRPLMGWATAWSFDRLRLWIEEGLDPRTVLRKAIYHAISRIFLSIALGTKGSRLILQWVCRLG